MSKIPILTAVRIIPRDDNYLDRKVGSLGEIFYDKFDNTLRLYDGKTAGGLALSRADLTNVAAAAFREKSVESRSATVIYTVTVAGPQAPDVGNKYVLNGVYRPILNFVVGYTYVFNQDDNTNVYFPNANGTTVNRHALNFSADNISGERGGGTSYLNDVEYRLNGAVVSQTVYVSSAFEAATSRQVRITVSNSTPAVLYYWCYNHVLMGNSVSIADPGSGTGSGGGVSVADTVPNSPNQGNLWLDTITGILYVYYNDGDSAQWIQPVFPFPDVSNLATISSLSAVATSGDYDDLTNRPNLAAIASSGDYDDLINVPAIALVLTDLGITDGTVGQVLTTDGDGNFTFEDPVGAPIGSFDFVGTNIDTNDSSSISVTPSVTFQSDVSVENEMSVRNNLTVENRLTVDNIILQGELSSQGSGTPEIVSDNEILLRAGTRVAVTSSPLKMCNFTSVERDLLITENGDVIYNTTTNKLQVRAAGVWVDLH